MAVTCYVEAYDEERPDCLLLSAFQLLRLRANPTIRRNQPAHLRIKTLWIAIRRKAPSSRFSKRRTPKTTARPGDTWTFATCRRTSGSTDGTELARQLETILDRDTQFDVGNLSRDPEGDVADNLAPNRDRVDTFHVNGQTLELDLERVTLHSGLSVWLFSSDSVARIPMIAQMTDNSVD